MNDISQTITDVISGNIAITAVPDDIRDCVSRGVRVRLERHEGHSTAHNPDGTVTVTNDRLRVTLPGSEFVSREQVFTVAMRVLGHRYETTMPPVEPTDEEIEQAAFDGLMYEFLAEDCRYNLGEVIMRLRGGHKMSEGMSAAVEAAGVRARHEFRNNPAPHLAEAKQRLTDVLNLDARYHAMIAAWCPNWQIEIIGDMPDQIGMCRYNAV